jgi:hypothetical protein
LEKSCLHRPEKNTVTIGLLSCPLVTNQELVEGFLCGASASNPSVPPHGAKHIRLAAETTVRLAAELTAASSERASLIYNQILGKGASGRWRGRRRARFDSYGASEEV